MVGKQIGEMRQKVPCIFLSLQFPALSDIERLHNTHKNLNRTQVLMTLSRRPKSAYFISFHPQPTFLSLWNSFQPVTSTREQGITLFNSREVKREPAQFPSFTVASGGYLVCTTGQLAGMKPVMYSITSALIFQKGVMQNLESSLNWQVKISHREEQGFVWG